MIATLLALMLSASATTPIVFVADSGTTGWKVNIEYGLDTVVRDLLVNEKEVVQLPEGKTYFVIASHPDINYKQTTLLPTAIRTNDTIRLHLSKQLISSNVSGMVEYSKELLDLRLSLYNIVDSSDFGKDPLATVLALDSVLNSYFENKAVSVMDKSLQNYVDRHVVEPVHALIRTTRCRLQVLQYRVGKTASMRDLLSDQLSQVAVCEPLSFLPNDDVGLEAYYLGQMATSVVTKSAWKWLRETFPLETDTSNTAINTTRLLAHVFGSSCACEVAAQAVQYVSGYVGKVGSPQHCDDPLIKLITELSAKRVSPHCRRVQETLTDVCRTLNATTVDTIICRSMINQFDTLVLSKDSVYVLHVWGTWCKPCIDRMDEIMKVSESLKSDGVRVIHFSWDNLKAFDRWLRLVSEQDQYFIASDQPPYNHIQTRLFIRTFPCFVIVGKGNKIIERCYDENVLRDRVRAARIQ